MPAELPICCWTNCENPAGAGTHTSIDVPQIGTTPMRVTLPVCEEHWYGNWVAERLRLRAENDRLLDALQDIEGTIRGLFRASASAAQRTVEE